MTHQPRQKKITLEFTLEEQATDDATINAVIAIERTRSDLTPAELDALAARLTDDQTITASILQALADSAHPRITLRA